MSPHLIRQHVTRKGHLEGGNEHNEHTQACPCADTVKFKDFSFTAHGQEKLRTEGTFAQTDTSSLSLSAVSSLLPGAAGGTHTLGSSLPALASPMGAVCQPHRVPSGDAQ